MENFYLGTTLIPALYGEIIRRRTYITSIYNGKRNTMISRKPWVKHSLTSLYLNYTSSESRSSRMILHVTSQNQPCKYIWGYLTFWVFFDTMSRNWTYFGRNIWKLNLRSEWWSRFWAVIKVLTITHKLWSIMIQGRISKQRDVCSNRSSRLVQMVSQDTSNGIHSRISSRDRGKSPTLMLFLADTLLKVFIIRDQHWCWTAFYMTVSITFKVCRSEIFYVIEWKNRFSRSRNF